MAAANSAKWLQEAAYCSVCLDYFTDLLTLDCGHNFCRSCITLSWEASDTNFPCPQCRDPSQQNMTEMEKLEMHLDSLRKQLEDLLKFKSAEAKKPEELRSETEIKRQKVETEFEELHQLLDKEKQILLLRLEEEEKKILQRIRENVTQLDEQSSSLTQLISEIEEKIKEKRQEPATELLKGMKDTLRRCQKMEFLELEAVSADLKMDFELSYTQQLKKFITKLGDWWMECVRYTVDVTLDPETAHPILVLSEDRKSVGLGNRCQNDVPDNPERFDTNWSVLGCEGFTSGRHYWEVQVAESWRVGVCKESVRRKGRGVWTHPTPDEGYWVLQWWYGEYSALTSPETPLSQEQIPRALGIFLDYEAGKVSFYNADNKSHLFTFTDTFTEKLRPFFYTYSEDPMRIRQVAACE